MLAFYKLIQKEDSTYFLNTYNDVLNLNSEFNQLGYIDFAETIIKRYQKLDNSIKNENVSKNNFDDLTQEGAESFPTEKYDDVFLFAVVHQEHEKNLKKLIDNIYNILNPNGRLFLTSFFLNENKISPKFAVQFAVEMIASSNDGKVYTFNEIESIIKTKFSDFEKIEDIPGPATLYVAMK